jgi:Na+-transporting NADH:ubiquinone oxidoreductase subunit C
VSDKHSNPGAERKKQGWFGAVLAMPNESPLKMLIVTVTLCFICSVLVSTATVLLRPQQQVNKALERQRNILQAAGLVEEGKSIPELFQAVETRVVDLATGEYVEMPDPASYDQYAAAKDPQQKVVIPPEIDIAKVRQRAKYASVYLVRRNNQLQYIILPVQGYGLWSTMYGFLALQGDAQTVAGLSFYQHGETPGLGGEIENPLWRDKWQGKQIYDDSGTIRFQVIKGAVDPAKADSRYQVDGIAGATLTSRGVDNLVRYWLGENGFGPYLEKIRTQEG